MLQSKQRNMIVYYNGITYAIRIKDTLFICTKPSNGKTIRTERFCRLNHGHTVDDYLSAHGYRQVSNDGKEETEV